MRFQIFLLFCCVTSGTFIEILLLGIRRRNKFISFQVLNRVLFAKQFVQALGFVLLFWSYEFWFGFVKDELAQIYGITEKVILNDVFVEILILILIQSDLFVRIQRPKVLQYAIHFSKFVTNTVIKGIMGIRVFFEKFI